MIVMASPFRGYPEYGAYTDTEYNKQMARRIMRERYHENDDVVPLVLLFDGVKISEENAQEICFAVIKMFADEVHFYYPENLNGNVITLSTGMRKELHLCKQLGIPHRFYPWEVWE